MPEQNKETVKSLLTIADAIGGTPVEMNETMFLMLQKSAAQINSLVQCLSTVNERLVASDALNEAMRQDKLDMAERNARLTEENSKLRQELDTLRTLHNKQETITRKVITENLLNVTEEELVTSVGDIFQKIRLSLLQQVDGHQILVSVPHGNDQLEQSMQELSVSPSLSVESNDHMSSLNIVETSEMTPAVPDSDDTPKYPIEVIVHILNGPETEQNAASSIDQPSHRAQEVDDVPNPQPKSPEGSQRDVSEEKKSKPSLIRRRFQSAKARVTKFTKKDVSDSGKSKPSLMRRAFQSAKARVTKFTKKDINDSEKSKPSLMRRAFQSVKARVTKFTQKDNFVNIIGAGLVLFVGFVSAIVVLALI